MSSLAIRCRSCTPVSSDELTAWLEVRIEELRARESQLLVRLTRLRQRLAETTIDDGWLIEIDLPGGPDQPLGTLAPAFEEILRDMRILGLDPLMLMPSVWRAEASRGPSPVAASPSRSSGPG